MSAKDLKIFADHWKYFNFMSNTMVKGSAMNICVIKCGGLNSKKGLKFVGAGDLYKICDDAHDTC